jgi:DNA replication protein DnaC
MLKQQSIDTLHRLKLLGMIAGLREQEGNPEFRSLDFEERLGLLIDREALEQENRLMASRLRKAKLRQNASIEDLDFRAARGLHRSQILDLASCAWIRAHENLLIIGPTGVGKTYLACGLAHKACREGFSSSYQRLGRLLQELAIARGEGRYLRFLKTVTKAEVLILDDWGLEMLEKDQRLDLLEIFEERHGQKSTIITSQQPVENWHPIIGDPTLAEAILDRLVHNAHTIILKGESMRKKGKPGPKNKTET